MFTTPRTHRIPLAIAVAALAFGAATLAEAGGPILLTVTGAVENTNRGAVDPAHDKLFVSNEVAFDKAMKFDADTLACLPQATVRTDFPMGGETVEFTGPLLADVLAAAGAEGATVTIQAMHGYAVEAPAAELVEKGAVMALARDGKPASAASARPRSSSRAPNGPTPPA